MSDAPPAVPSDSPPTSDSATRPGDDPGPPPTPTTPPTPTKPATTATGLESQDITGAPDQPRHKKTSRWRRKRKAEPQHAAPPTTGQRAARSAFEWAVIIVAALFVAFVVKTFLIQAFSIPSQSMEPRLTTGDRVFVNKLSYRLHDVNRGDIVVFERPPCDTGSDTDHLIKRVVGIEGDTVEARNGRVLVGGRVLDEPYLPAGIRTEDFGPVHVPPGALWVMGDNRGNSKDSRFLCEGTTTFIAEDSLVGRAFVRVWPLGEFTLL